MKYEICTTEKLKLMTVKSILTIDSTFYETNQRSLREVPRSNSREPRHSYCESKTLPGTGNCHYSKIVKKTEDKGKN